MPKSAKHKFTLVLRWDPEDGTYIQDPTPLKEKPGKYFLLGFANKQKLGEVQLDGDLQGLVRGFCNVLGMNVDDAFDAINGVRRKANIKTARYSSFLWNRVSDGVPDWTAEVVKKVTNNTQKVFETSNWKQFQSCWEEFTYQLAW